MLRCNAQYQSTTFRPETSHPGKTLLVSRVQLHGPTARETRNGSCLRDGVTISKFTGTSTEEGLQDINLQGLQLNQLTAAT